MPMICKVQRCTQGHAALGLHKESSLLFEGHNEKVSHDLLLLETQEMVLLEGWRYFLFWWPFSLFVSRGEI